MLIHIMNEVHVISRLTLTFLHHLDIYLLYSYWIEHIGPGGVAAAAPAVGFFCKTMGTITPPGSLHPGNQLDG